MTRRSLAFIIHKAVIVFVIVIVQPKVIYLSPLTCNSALSLLPSFRGSPYREGGTRGTSETSMERGGPFSLRSTMSHSFGSLKTSSSQPMLLSRRRHRTMRLCRILYTKTTILYIITNSSCFFIFHFLTLSHPYAETLLQLYELRWLGGDDI